MSLIGIVPFVLFRDCHFEYLQTEGKIYTKLMGLFAAGNLLGQVFFTLLPKVYNLHREEDTILPSLMMSCLLGYLSMYMLELYVKICARNRKKALGYCNLIANVLDNFSHGMALAGSYALGIRTGLFTTLGLMLHELPHEISDVFILIHSGFDRKRAFKYQGITCLFCLIGSILSLYCARISINSIDFFRIVASDDVRPGKRVIPFHFADINNRRCNSRFGPKNVRISFLYRIL